MKFSLGRNSSADIARSVSPEMNKALQTETFQSGKANLSRTSTRKVRTGCLTCKKRHVKCDEAKPHCDNCTRSQRHCEGYVAEAKKPAGLEGGQLCWYYRERVRGDTPRLQLQLDPESLDFGDATSMRYFQEFVGLLQGTWNNAASGGDLWAVTLPQLARNNSTLRYAAMAVGALSKWHEQSTSKSLRAMPVPASQTASEDAYYFHALTYYCKALKMQSERASVQDAVFFSVLSLFFETLRGNRKAALDHVNHGLALLLAVLTDQNANHHVCNFAPSPRPLLGAVADIFTHLALQARIVLRDRVGSGPPLPHLVSGLRKRRRTMESFMILLSQLPRSPAITNQIPALFDSLDEFERYLVFARRGQTTMVSIMAESMQTAGVMGCQDESVITSFYHVLLDNPRIREFCANSRRQRQALDAAFLPLFNRVIMTSEAGSPAYLKAVHLRLQYLGAHLFEDPPQYLDVEMVRAQTPSFREYLSLAEMALCSARRATANPAQQLSLQCGLAWNLCLLALFCRDALARDHAVELLKDYPGQDGLWNTRSLNALALRNRAVEQANAVEGTHMEQWQRLWRREFVFEDGGERILFRYLQKEGTTGEWKLVEETAEVRAESGHVHWKRQPLTGAGGPLMAHLYSSL